VTECRRTNDAESVEDGAVSDYIMHAADGRSARTADDWIAFERFVRNNPDYVTAIRTPMARAQELRQQGDGTL